MRLALFLLLWASPAMAVEQTSAGGSSGAVDNADLDSSSVTLLGPSIDLSGSEVTGSLPAASIAAGALGASVRVSSLTQVNTGPATGGSATIVPVITMNAQGQIISMTSAAITGVGTVVVSTTMPLLAVATTETTYGVCHATLTYTGTSCTAVDIIFAIDAQDDTNSRLAGANVLVNGAYTTNYPIGTGMDELRPASATTIPSHPLRKTITLTGLNCSGGTTNFCLTLKVAAGTLTIPPSATVTTKSSWTVRVFQ